MTEWVKCSERMPERGRFIAWTDSERVTCGYFVDMQHSGEPAFVSTCCDNWAWPQHVTHWMPLTKPPSE